MYKIYRKKNKIIRRNQLKERFSDAFDWKSNFSLRRPFNLKRNLLHVRINWSIFDTWFWTTCSMFIQLTYFFGWITIPSALVHRKSLIRSLFSTFPWHVITCDLPTGKRNGACDGVIRSWGLSQLTLSEVEEDEENKRQT